MRHQVEKANLETQLYQPKEKGLVEVVQNMEFSWNIRGALANFRNSNQYKRIQTDQLLEMIIFR